MDCPTLQSEDLARDQSLVPGLRHGHKGPVTEGRHRVEIPPQHRLGQDTRQSTEELP